MKNINEIYVQDAKESDVPKLCSDNQLIEIIINNSFKEFNFDPNNNIKYDDNYRKSLGKIICSGIKKFIFS